MYDVLGHLTYATRWIQSNRLMPDGKRPSMRSLSVEAGLSKAYVEQIVARRVRTVGVNAIVGLAQRWDVRVEWMITGLAPIEPFVGRQFASGPELEEAVSASLASAIQWIQSHRKRENEDLSQRKLATEAGLSASYAEQIVNQRNRSVGVDGLVMVAQRWDVRVEWMILGVPPIEPFAWGEEPSSTVTTTTKREVKYPSLKRAIDWARSEGLPESAIDEVSGRAYAADPGAEQWMRELLETSQRHRMMAALDRKSAEGPSHDIDASPPTSSAAGSDKPPTVRSGARSKSGRRRAG